MIIEFLLERIRLKKNWKSYFYKLYNEISVRDIGLDDIYLPRNCMTKLFNNNIFKTKRCR